MRYFILLLLAAVTFGADLPPDAAQALAVYEKTCKEAQAKADDAKSAAATKLLPLLEAAQKKATQKGDLDVALVLKAKREEVIAAALAALTPAPAGFNPAGLWQSTDGKFSVTISADGSWKSSADTFFGKWDITSDGLILTSLGGKGQVVTVPASRKGTWVLNGGKTSYAMVLAKPAR